MKFGPTHCRNQRIAGRRRSRFCPRIAIARRLQYALVARRRNQGDVLLRRCNENGMIRGSEVWPRGTHAAFALAEAHRDDIAKVIVNRILDCAQNVGVGGMLFLSALWLLLKYKPWKVNGLLKHGEVPSGEKSVEFWESQIERSVRSAVHDALIGRNEELRKIMLECVKQGVRETMQYFYGFRRSGDD